MNTAPNSAKNVLTSDVEIKGNLRFSGELTEKDNRVGFRVLLQVD